jgi:hypothetical protein
VDSGLPPLAAAYHWIELPVATKLATVGLLLAQKDCDALPVGAAGLVVTAIVMAEEVVWAAAQPAETTVQVIWSPLAKLESW